MWQEIGTVIQTKSNEIYSQFFKERCNYKNKLRVAIDCGGASMTLSAPEVFANVGLEVIPVFCEPDPLFSKRPSDPKPQNLDVLIKKVIRQINALWIHLVQNQHIGLWLILNPSHMVGIEIGFHGNVVFSQNRIVTIKAPAFGRIGYHSAVLNTGHIGVSAFT